MNSAPSKGAPWFELLLTLPVFAGIFYTAWFMYKYGYLPQPYFYEPDGVYMDFFSVATYAHGKDAFNVFGTIYPPLSFAFLNFVTWGPCYVGSGLEEARLCDQVGRYSMYGICVVNAVLVWFTYRKIDRRTAWPRAIAMSVGFPMSYTLERGNLLLFAFTCVLLGYGPLLRSARLRWLFAALAVNFKIYLIGTLFAQLLRRRWRWFEGAVVMTVLVYLVSFLFYYGEGSPAQIYDNITLYAGGFQGASFLDIWYPSSMVPIRGVLEGGGETNITGVLGSEWADRLLVIVKLIMGSAAGSIMIAAAGALWRPAAVPMHRLIFLSISMAVILSEVGGYIQIFLLLFIFMEKWKGFGRPFAITSAYVLSTSLDYTYGSIVHLSKNSFLTGRTVYAEYGLSFGMFARPLLMHMVIVALAWVTIAEVWADARSHGWRVPWRRVPRLATESRN